MTKYICVAITALAVALCGAAGLAQSRTFRPKNGFIPDGRTAVRVGEAVLEAIYGEKQIASERPFSAKLKDGTWIVTGSFPKSQRFGGVAEIRISKKEGCIVSVHHGM